MTTTPFGEIMRTAVEATPGAVGGAFADPEGEMVDSFSSLEKFDWAVPVSYTHLTLPTKRIV